MGFQPETPRSVVVGEAIFQTLWLAASSKIALWNFRPKSMRSLANATL
jgi:hypothetical protein